MEIYDSIKEFIILNLWNPIWIRVILGIVLAPILAGYLNGIDRIITARLQGRKGPPLHQPFYDMIKLFAKVGMITSPMQVVYAVAYLLFAILTFVLLILGQDFIMIIFSASLAAVMFILAGMATKSPYSQIGSHREIMQVLAYEPILILTGFGIFFYTGSFEVKSLFKEGLAPMLYYLPLLFFALTIMLTIKMRKSPFDFATSHHGHQELVKGITTEFSGPYLFIVELAHWYEFIFVMGLIVIFFATNLWIGILLAFIFFLLELVIDNITPRLTYKWMLWASWTSGIAITVINLIWLYWFRA